MKHLLLILLLLAFQAGAAPVARVATFANYAPFCFYAADADREQYQELIPPGQKSALFRGLAWEVVLASFHRAGYSVHLTIVPWTRAVRMLDEGAVDGIFPAIKNPQRIQRYRFSEQLVYPENRLLFYTLRTDDQSTTELADLRGKNTGMIRGFSYGPVWDQLVSDQQLRTVRLNDIRQGFDMLENGRIDALVGYELSHDYHLKNWQRSELFQKSPAFDQARSFLMGRRAAEVLMADFDQGRNALETEGQYQQLLKKWGLE